MTVGNLRVLWPASNRRQRIKQAGALEILSLETAGNTAVARVRDDYLGLTFLDTLSLLKAEGEWRIYNKLFHVEGPGAESSGLIVLCGCFASITLTSFAG